ncbi:hypothetical protein M0R89_01475 [Halorussus limi]|uniref:Uncharacterized protein n=1 Tax=Halorussus limi TaxID=2938695 RepID=A0A8U0HVN1_9EURY|nr:hypothetical protein [Halorussus limi]UPV74756.1 hypothetical protein M0R89_01475 [Halorussus limi]
MTHCYNCGHSGTFVLLAQFALSVPGPADEAPTSAEGPSDSVEDRSDTAEPRSDASGRRFDGPHCPSDGADCQRLPSSGDLSLAVQCPACDSTDVGVAAGDLLARYGSSTTS